MSYKSANAKLRVPTLGLAVLALSLSAATSNADPLFVGGSSFTVSGTNSPSTFTAPATLTAGAQTVGPLLKVQREALTRILAPAPLMGVN